MAVGLKQATGRTIITNSGAVTASSATPNIGLAANAALYQSVPACDAVDIILNVTANTGTGSSLQAQWVEMQTSPDGGTTWVTFWRSANLTTSTTTIRASMKTNGLGNSEAAAQTVGINTTTATLVQNCCITADQRVVWTLPTATGNVPSLTFGLYCIPQPVGSRGY